MTAQDLRVLLVQGLKCTNNRKFDDQLVARVELLDIDLVDHSTQTVTATSGPDAIDLLIFQEAVKKANSM